jgi:hypothetical protein
MEFFPRNSNDLVVRKASGYRSALRRYEAYIPASIRGGEQIRR